VKSRRHHALNRELLAVKLQHGTHCVRIAVQVIAPERIADHCQRLPCVCCLQGPTHMGVYTHQREKVLRDMHDHRHTRAARRSHGIGQQHESRCLLHHIACFGKAWNIGNVHVERVRRSLRLLQHNQLLGVWQRNRAQQYGVHHSQHRSRCTQPKAQHQDRRDRKP
jgi:hypothetical protein